MVSLLSFTRGAVKNDKSTKLFLFISGKHVILLSRRQGWVVRNTGDLCCVSEFPEKLLIKME